MKLPVNDDRSAAGQQGLPSPLPHSAGRSLALASARLGGLGVAAYFILAMAALIMTSSVERNSLAGVVAGAGATLNVLPFAMLVFLANGLGLVLSGIALCRENGRELGALGLLLNTVPGPVFFGFLAAILPQPPH